MLTALDENTTRVRIVSNCDPKLAYMPNWLLNLAIKHCAYYVMVVSTSFCSIVIYGLAY